MRGPFALRSGDWKYLEGNANAGYGKAKANPKGEAKNPPAPQLFNLATDLSETKNLAAEQPQRVAELAALLDKIRGVERAPGAKDEPGAKKQ